MALSGGHPLDEFGEWDGFTLTRRLGSGRDAVLVVVPAIQDGVAEREHALVMNDRRAGNVPGERFVQSLKKRSIHVNDPAKNWLFRGKRRIGVVVPAHPISGLRDKEVNLAASHLRIKLA